MNNRITQHEACDKILVHLIKNPNEVYDEYRTQREILNGFHIDEVKHFLNVIKKVISPEIVKVYRYNNGGIQWSVFTDHFMDQGGFTGIYIKKLEKEKEEQERTSKEYEKLHLEIEGLRNQFFDYPQTKSRTRRLETWTVITVILAAIAVVISIVKK